jgi:hypothetical protein
LDVIKTSGQITSDAEDEDGHLDGDIDGGDVSYRAEVTAEDGDPDAFEMNLHPKITIPES